MKRSLAHLSFRVDHTQLPNPLCTGGRKGTWRCAGKGGGKWGERPRKIKYVCKNIIETMSYEFSYLYANIENLIKKQCKRYSMVSYLKISREKCPLAFLRGGSSLWFNMELFLKIFKDT